MALQAADGPAERLARINSPSSGLAQDDLEIIVNFEQCLLTLFEANN